MVKGQLKALGGGGVSLVSIAILLGYLNTSFNLGMEPAVVTAAAGLIGVLIWAIVYFIPNINPNIVNLDGLDFEGYLIEASKRYDLPADVIEDLAKLAEDSLKGLK